MRYVISWTEIIFGFANNLSINKIFIYILLHLLLLSNSFILFIYNNVLNTKQI